MTQRFCLPASFWLRESVTLFVRSPHIRYTSQEFKPKAPSPQNVSKPLLCFAVLTLRLTIGARTIGQTKVQDGVDSGHGNNTTTHWSNSPEIGRASCRGRVETAAVTGTFTENT